MSNGTYKTRVEKRDQILQVRLSKSELDEIRRAAKDVALDVSALARTILIQHIRGMKVH